ncbi:peptidyl-prolyl cis-trans isomerase fkbp8 [Plasmopara halstedii]|uniref:peptidylprolyl isomerase n=1 Tax=Plasmopara halstedii TaxID=4781 RepID=A0A0P1ABF1_PLAHL|nr:peptidyl-prolyl cis-trans isomerase fkbp8 [Plasmopara halstedii]CEG37730.1 peptidyl-prolyl cis-trans isomerase fkbp8 [Plasmopara halstedii]|eukprot:XP_024574099.1 peptidyl-prolyl cis-trans isomerase fkbp8 [Plasmopara halstedii]
MVLITESERKDFEDILGSGGILRRMLTTNNDGIQAEFGEEVGVKYSAWVLKSGQKVAIDETRKFRIGDGEVMPALELVAKMMHVGEECEVRCDARFAYGDVGLEPYVAPGDEIKLLVELCRVGKRMTSEMSSQELIIEATQKKESGNRYFKEKNYDQAAKLYKRALKLLEMWEHTEEDTAQCKELLIALGNNVANVQHKLLQFKEARQSSLEVLQLDGKNIKAMYRISQIALDQSEFEEANMFLRKALEIEPENSKVRQLLVKLKKKKRDQQARERKLYAKLGGDRTSNPVKTGKLSVLLSIIRRNAAIIAAVAIVIVAILVHVFVGESNREIFESPDNNVNATE